jgi:hypothetical protein
MNIKRNYENKKEREKNPKLNQQSMSRNSRGTVIKIQV